MNSDWTSRYIDNDRDRLWLDEGLRSKYRLRKPAAPFWRLPVIRHIRAVIHAIRAEIWTRRLLRAGFIPPGFEAWIAYAIWKGWQ